MLRVNSLLYIEKLWYQPALVDYPIAETSIHPTSSYDESSLQEVPENEEVLAVEEQVIPIEEEQEEPEESAEESQQVETSDHVPSIKEEKRDSKLIEEEEESIESKPVVVIPTSISSSSSIVPPVTPSSVHSTGHDMPIDKVSTSPRPRTTSLIRRETTKLNDRRKSLTHKLKRVLTAKSSDNKRNSL